MTTGVDPDRLFELLPRYLRGRDAEVSEPLRALLAVIEEQVGLVEADIEQLYDNWFIETCADWAVPYLGDLIGYRMLRGYDHALSAGHGHGDAAKRLAARLAPRRDVAGTVGSRRRKGTLHLLEEIADTVADWPARAVEFRHLLAQTQAVRLYGASESTVARRAAAAGGRLVDVRHGARLDLLNSPFDELAHGVEVPRITATHRQGRYAPPEVGVFVWRLRPYSITQAPAYCIDRARHHFTFSVLGNDTPLVTKPVPAPPGHPTTAENVPAFILRRALHERLADFYGPDKSFSIWRDGQDEPIPLANIVVADLSGWAYRARHDQVIVDPVLGRMAFSARSAPSDGVWVNYHYAFSDDTGGGEYPRTHTVARGAKVYRVGPGQPFELINAAYRQWRADNEHDDQPTAIIEITDSGAYQEQLEFVLDRGERLEIRAAQGRRPVLRLLDWSSNRPDALKIRGNPTGSTKAPLPQVVLDGLLVTGRGVSVQGLVGSVAFRHCTLVPGWSLEPHCAPVHPEEASLVLENTSACVEVERSILGTIMVDTDEVGADPLAIHLADSILDANGSDRVALSAPECRHAHAVLHIHRSTVIGQVHTHAVRIAEDSIFDGTVRVARRGTGCMRFCYVPPRSRTPRRYHCQPDLAWEALRERLSDEAHRGTADPTQWPRLRDLLEQRIRPQFTSRRYGTPAYGQLAAGCATEITSGAEDGSELGAFHDLFQPQREANLRARLAEFTPAGTDAGIVYVT